MNKPMYILQTYLDLLIYKFCYEGMTPKWGKNNNKFGCINTDSLIVTLKT